MMTTKGLYASHNGVCMLFVYPPDYHNVVKVNFHRSKSGKFCLNIKKLI